MSKLNVFASFSFLEVYTHLQERDVAEQASEKMNEYFREGRIKMEKVQTPIESDLELDGTVEMRFLKD